MDDHLAFYSACQEIERSLGISPGQAQAKLRELCRSGEVRSWREPYSIQGGEPQGEGPSERIEPSEWRQREIDLMTDSDGCRYFVSVSETDFQKWLRTKQSRKTVPSRKLDLAKIAVNALWPNGIPESVQNKQIETEVSNYIKTNYKPNIEISRDTILRAANRK